MTGGIAEFFSDLRAAWREHDPLIDLRTLPPEILRSIRPWVDDRLTTPRFERRVPFTGMTISRDPPGPFIRASELLSIFAKFTEMAAAAERLAKQRAAETEAEIGLAVTKGRADSVSERLMRATEAHTAAEVQLKAARAEIDTLKRQVAVLIEKNRAAAEVQRQLDEQRATKAALSQLVADLTAETKASRREAGELAAKNDALVSEFQRMTEAGKAECTDLRHRLQAAAEHGRGLAETAKQAIRERDAAAERVRQLTADNAALRHEVTRLTQVNEERAGFTANLVKNARKVLTDFDEAEREVGHLRAEQQRLKDETRRWKAHARGEARAAARYRCENLALKEQNAQLDAEAEGLDSEVRNLLAEQQQLSDETDRWRTRALRQMPACRVRAEIAARLADRWLRQRWRLGERAPCAA